MGGSGWGAAAPILRVSSLDASLTYYLNVLGFRLDWRLWRRMAGGEYTLLEILPR